MNTQPEALRLAYWMDDMPSVIPGNDSNEWHKAAIELRRLHAIEMAREAGGRAQQNKNCDVEYLMSADALKAFAALVRADAIADERDKWMERTAILIRGEREACAKVCDEVEMKNTRQGPADCAAAIRARGNT